MPTLRQFPPRCLAPGARIALIAPASPFDRSEFELGLTRLRRRYDVQHRPDIFEQRGYLAGDDQRRLSELQEVLAQPKIAAIIAARGGYGSTRLLARIEPALLRPQAPLLIGFSDLTALHALWAQAEQGSIHGNMVAGLGRASEAQFERFVGALEGRFSERFTGLERIATGAAEGVLLGGNLAVLCALLGTPWFPPLQDSVLFLEDIGERPYRVDRMLTSLRDAGALRGVRAIALGAFVQGDAGPDGITLADVLSERLGDLGIPVAVGVPAGHIADNFELPFGRRVGLDADAGVLQLQLREKA
jgi:muramoyltetrapeptide carboxypeptidase